MLNFFLVLLYQIAKNLWGTLNHPYLTWKRIIRESSWPASLLLLLIFISYFALREPIRWGNLRWYGIFVESISTPKIKIWIQAGTDRFLVSLATYFLLVWLITTVGLLVKSPQITLEDFKTHLSMVFKVWIYSYLPTILWFMMAAGLFTIWPPPRHPSYLGFLFSAIFLTASAALLIWKGLLYFLTLRLAVGLTPTQIFWTTIILTPIIAAYTQLLYQLNIFKVPFI